ncbi:hypothetical protein MASR2M18_16000 [Ignavibacteria bacterium]|nr:hypothetical protein [Bacteroidota bacterium]MCZ2133560.1 hypothetical protein [Bacteroidota bacterium]
MKNQSVIPIGEVRAGMALAQPLINGFGRLLLPAETKIEEQHLGLFKIWGILFVSIHGKAQNSEPLWQRLTPELLERGLKYLRKRVFWNPRGPIENDLFKAAIRMQAWKILREEQLDGGR